MASYPARRSTRLRDYDYAQAGAYFVTLCIEHRLPLLGNIHEGTMHLSPPGEMVATVWTNLEQYYRVGIDAFVVMPNHVHGIVVLCDLDGEDRDGAAVPTPALSLSTVVQRFKTFTAHQYGTGVASAGWPRYPGRLWQHRFHEHVIRHERELAAIREYIVDNPPQWHRDRENPDHQGSH